MDGLVFGWRTAVLSMAIAQLLAIAIALTRQIANRTANRTLAALLVVLAGIVTPWAIGFAGFYDRWQWLTFAPFAITLAIGPLLWLYGHALIEGAWPRRGWRHLTPALAQLLFLTAGFLLPMPLKSEWASVALPPYGVVTNAGTVIGLVLYGAAGLRLLARYRARLAEQRSDDARFASRWLSRSIAATLVLLPVWAGYALYDAIEPLGYLRLMGLHLAIAGFALYLAIEGWRHAALPFPRLEDAPAAPEPEPVPLRDWRTLGEHWAEQTRAAGWASDPELTLARLARHLGTNSSYVSRALNEGLGLGFSAFVNRLRSATVADALKAGDRRDLLELAFDAGFASKASFNRAFRAEYGMSPSAYRRVSEAELSPAT